MSADLVRRLLADQHPDLARLPVEFLANGWDNELYRVGDELVARLPRRALGAQIIINEQRWLPGLAPRLPLPIPRPERTGVPACGYPYSWSVVPYLPGVPAAQASSFDPAAAAAAVGGFLGALHVPAPADAPAQPVPGRPAGRTRRYLRGQPRPDRRPGRPGRGAARVGRGAAAPGYDGPPVWLHGDLHPANILVNDGQVSGVIDFGDITAGDPASDLSVAWMLLPPGGHAIFWSAYQAASSAGGTAGCASDALRARGQRLGTEPCGRVPGPLRGQSGSPASRPPHPQHRAALLGGVAGGGGGEVRPAECPRPGRPVRVVPATSPRLACSDGGPAERGQIALARPAAVVVRVGVVQVATRGAAAAARSSAGRVAGPDQVLEFAAGPVAMLGPGVLARSADDRGELPDVQEVQQAAQGHGPRGPGAHGRFRRRSRARPRPRRYSGRSRTIWWPGARPRRRSGHGYRRDR